MNIDSQICDISLCVATFQRPAKLQRLLQSLFLSIENCPATVEIIIVDNDARQSAHDIVTSWENQNGQIIYLVEPRQNISHARNLALAHASGGWIAFIDDDETADPQWLASYWKIAKALPADGYFGPVLPALEESAPFWFDAELFLSRPRFANGTRLYQKMRTGNAFIRKEIFAAHQFDPAFGLTGGGDAAFFEARARDGAKFLWNDKAVTREYYPPERVRLRWLAMRYFRSGLVYSRIRIQKKEHARIKIFLKALAVSIYLFIAMPIQIFRSVKKAIFQLLRLFLQAGHIAACFNFTYHEYKK